MVLISRALLAASLVLVAACDSPGFTTHGPKEPVGTSNGPTSSTPASAPESHHASPPPETGAGTEAGSAPEQRALESHELAFVWPRPIAKPVAAASPAADELSVLACARHACA